MSRRMRIIGALTGLRKAGNAAERALRGKRLASTCKQLMCICLMPHVEHNLVLRAVQNAVTRHNNVNSTQRRRHMAARMRSSSHNFVANLTR